MTRDLKPYPKLKDSGNESLGSVPEHWEVRRLGQVGTFSKGNGGNKEDEVATGIPCVRYGDLYTSHQCFIRKSRACVSSERAKVYTPIKFGDVLFAGSGETIDEIGKSAVNLIQSEVCCGGDVILFRPTRAVDARYMGYATDCAPAATQKSKMGRGITVMHIYSAELKHMTVALPPLPEQTAIARYLDYLDRRIQRYIRAKERLIALLEEYKQGLIHQAVTGQIDVRTGERYGEYKESGVEWLPRIPAHWQMKRSKHVYRPRKELAKPGDIQLSATQAFGVIGQEDYEKRIGRRIVKISLHLEKRRHVEPDDFVISMRSFQGGLERAWVRGCIRSSYVVLRPVTGVAVPFFGFLFKSVGYINALQSTADFIRDGQDLNYDNFSRVDVPCPPLEEQRCIAQVLNRTLRAVSSTIDHTSSRIDLLREYHTRLIADVVTGKLDVREAAANLPDVAPLEAESGTPVLANKNEVQSLD